MCMRRSATRVRKKKGRKEQRPNNAKPKTNILDRFSAYPKMGKKNVTRDAERRLPQDSYLRKKCKKNDTTMMEF